MFVPANGIHEVVMLIKGARSFCPLGKKPYTHNFIVKFEPDKKIPDYLDVQAWIDETFNESKAHTIEEAVCELAQHLDWEYEPNCVKVFDHVSDAAHFPVIVKKERRKQSGKPING